jgi:hypothetical protein
MILQILGVALISLLTIAPTTLNNNNIIQDNLLPNIEIQPLVAPIDVNSGEWQLQQVNRVLNNVTAKELYLFVYNSISYRKYVFDYGYTNNQISSFLIEWAGSSAVTSEFPNDNNIRTSGTYYTGTITNTFHRSTIVILPPPDSIIPTISLSSTQIYANAIDYPNGLSVTVQNNLMSTLITVQDNNPGVIYEFNRNRVLMGSTNVYEEYGVRARDTAGNVSAYVWIEIFYVIDTTPPYISISTDTINKYRSEYPNGLSTTVQNNLMSAIITVTDDQDPNPTFEYNRGLVIIDSNNPSETYGVRGKDSSNNYSSFLYITINYIDDVTDVTPPTIQALNTTLGFYRSQYPNGVSTTNQEQSILQNIIIADNSGTVTVQYNRNRVIIDSNNTSEQYGVRAIDNAGNVSNFVYITINYIDDVTDLTPPTITRNIEQVEFLRTNYPVGVSTTIQLQAILDSVTLQDNRTGVTYELNTNLTVLGSNNTSNVIGIRAKDTSNLFSEFVYITLIWTDNTTTDNPPTIIGSNSISFLVGLINNNQEFLQQYFVISDNGTFDVDISPDIQYDTLGFYNVTITVTDNDFNQVLKNVRVHIRSNAEIDSSYNPLTDLLSGIFGATLSMVFTIGTINILGFRLLDAMGIIILGAVIWFVYKAIRG